MKTYEISVEIKHIHRTQKKFASEEQAWAWAEEQCQTVDLHESGDWDFTDGTFEVWDVTERDEE